MKHYPRNRRTSALAAAFLVVFSGCATFVPAFRGAAVLDTVDAINGAALETLVERSAVPFVFDAEILSRGLDVETLWRGLREAGFVLEEAEVIAVRNVTGESYRMFSTSDEMRIFFEKHVPSDAYTATIGSARGTFVLLLAGRRGDPARILGFGGPM